MARRRRVEYRLRPAATQDLESIWAYSAEQWGVELAHRYTDDIVNAFEKLASNPEQGGSSDHVREGYRRYRVGRHIIYYRIAEYGVDVVRILHGRMDAPTHL